MKRIPLKVTSIELLDGTVQPLDYKDYIRGIVKSPLDPNKGIGVDEMFGSLRVLTALDKAGDVLELEDADFEFFVTKIKAARFMTVDANIAQFVKDVTEVA